MALPFGLSTAPMGFTVVAETQTSLELRRLPVQPQMWLVLTDTGSVADPSENTGSNLPTGLSGAAVHVLNRSANSHREAS